MFKCIVAVLLSFFSYTSLAAQTKLACIGNSITQGYNAPSYTEKLKTLLGSKYTVFNAGVSGCTLLKKCNKSYWTEGKLKVVLSSKPDIVTIMLGTNDTKYDNWSKHGTQFRDDYNALIDTIQKLQSSPEVWVVLPCPIWDNRYDIRNSIMLEIIPILKDIAAQRNLGIIDANTPLTKAKNYFPDGVHPNANGADSLARIFCKALTTIVKIERSEIGQITPEMSLSIRPHTFITFSQSATGRVFVARGSGSRLFDLRGAAVHSHKIKSRNVLINCFYAP